jgi:hypothetical protein
MSSVIGFGWLLPIVAADGLDALAAILVAAAGGWLNRSS